MSKKSNSKGGRGDFRFMMGVLDTKTHSTVLYAKNLDLKSADITWKEWKKKFG